MPQAPSSAFVESGVELGEPVVPPGFAALAAEPSPSSELEHRVGLLDEILAAQSRESTEARMISGGVSLGVGIAGVGGSIALLATFDARDPVFTTLAGLIGALSLSSIAIGAVSLSITTTAERRYERFTAERDAHHLSPRAIGRYEGALWAEAELSLDARLLSIGSATLITALGGLEVAITALYMVDDTSRILGYSTGAVFAALGVFQLVTAFDESGAERRFRRYEEATGPTVALAPFAAPGLFGLSASGTF